MARDIDQLHFGLQDHCQHTHKHVENKWAKRRKTLKEQRENQIWQKNSSICVDCLENVVAFGNKTLGTANPFHSAGLIPNYICLSGDKDCSAQNSKIPLFWSPLLRKLFCFSDHRVDSIPELPPRCYSVDLLALNSVKGPFSGKNKGREC